jgi:hypothetical protein
MLQDKNEKFLTVHFEYFFFFEGLETDVTCEVRFFFTEFLGFGLNQVENFGVL